MSNVNTTADVIRRQNNSQPIILTLATQGHFAFSLNGQPAVANVPNPLALVDSGSPSPVGNASAVGVPLTVGAFGTISSTARGQQVQIDVNQGNGLSGLSPAIASTGLQSIPNGAGAFNDNWGIIIEGLWDSTSLNFRGIYYGWFGTSQIAQASLVLSTPAALANLQFNVAVTWPGPTVGTTSLSLTEFSVDLE